VCEASVAGASTARCPRSLHDALPICRQITKKAGSSMGLVNGQETDDSSSPPPQGRPPARIRARIAERPRPRLDLRAVFGLAPGRSEEHTSELQSREKLVCRLLLEKKK